RGRRWGEPEFRRDRAVCGGGREPERHPEEHCEGEPRELDLRRSDGVDRHHPKMYRSRRGSAAPRSVPVLRSIPTATTPVLIAYGPSTRSVWPRAVSSVRTRSGTRFSISSTPGKLSWLSNELNGCSELIRGASIACWRSIRNTNTFRSTLRIC